LTPGVDFGFAAGVGADIYTGIDIRGVTAGQGTTVGIYLDDTPIPPVRAGTYLRSFPVTFDLNRVEVLRGPQAVLLGDPTQGGAIRFILNQPSLTTSTALVRAEWSTTEYGGMSYEAGAAVGGPLRTDVLGFRLSGWYRDDGGYVDRVDPLTGATLDANANRFIREVVRGALTIAPTDNWLLTPTLFYQSTRLHDTSTLSTDLSNPADGVFKNGYPPAPSDDTVYVGSVTINADFPRAELRAVTSYVKQIANATQPTVTTSGSWVAAYYAAQQWTASQDVRLTSADPDASLTWFAGAFYSRDHSRNPERGQLGDFVMVSDTVVTQSSQLAGFGQIALKVSKGLTASVGLRIGRSTYDSFTEVVPFQAEDSDTWVTPRFGLSFQADEHNLLYLTVAKGYESGGVYPGIANDPRPYPPETLWSYEIGSKHVLANGRLHLETSVFHTRWNNGQPTFNIEGFSDPPPGTAESNGFGLTSQALVTEQTKVALEVAYTDPHITQTVMLDGVPFVRKGDSLGGSPWYIRAWAERNIPLRNDITASVRLEDVFRSAPAPNFSDDPASIYYSPSRRDPSTNLLNARADIRWSGFDVAATLNNVLGSQPFLSDNSGGRHLTFTPRTFSVSCTWRY
jgi:outer membrane receptor protein involved in Fe transport